MNPFEKFMQEKRAFGFAEVGKGIPGAALQGAATAAATAGVAGMGLAAHAIFNAITKQRDFNAMMEANPDLEEYHGQNPKRFNMMFTTLRNMNPGFSKDPLVAGTFIRRMAESPLTAGGVAVEALRSHAPGPLQESFMSGAQKGVAEGMAQQLRPRQGPSMEELTAQEEMKQQMRQRYAPPEPTAKEVRKNSYSQEVGRLKARQKHGNNTP